MPGWQDFLNRFRPAGAPGSAAPRGVPADRSAAAAAELMPVLVRLDDAHREAERIRATALEQAERLRRDGREAAAALLEHARENVETVAAQAATAVLAAAQTEVPAEPPGGPRLPRRAEERLPAYIDRVVTTARELVGEVGASTGAGR